MWVVSDMIKNWEFFIGFIIVFVGSIINIVIEIIKRKKISALEWLQFIISVTMSIYFAARAFYIIE